MPDSRTVNGHVRYMAVRNRISYPVGDYLYHSNLRLWIRAGDRYRSIQNASCRFCTLYPACPFRLGSGMAGNNEDQIKSNLVNSQELFEKDFDTKG